MNTMTTEIEKLNDAENPEEWQSIVRDAGGSLDYTCDGSTALNIPEWAFGADNGIEIEARKQHETNEDGSRSAFVPINIEYLGVKIKTGAWLTIDSDGEIIAAEDDHYAPGYSSYWPKLADFARNSWELDKAEAIDDAF